MSGGKRLGSEEGHGMVRHPDKDTIGCNRLWLLTYSGYGDS